MSPSTATIAPVPARDSRSIASAISSATDWRSLCEKRRMKCDWPSRARALRSSGWNTTTAANAPYVNTTLNRKLIIWNFASRATKYATDRIITPTTICIARVPTRKRRKR